MKFSSTLAFYVLAANAFPLPTEQRMPVSVFAEISSEAEENANPLVYSASSDGSRNLYPKTRISNAGRLCMDYAGKRLTEIPHECIYEVTCARNDLILHPSKSCFKPRFDAKTSLSVQELEKLEVHCLQEAICEPSGNHYYSADEEEVYSSENEINENKLQGENAHDVSYAEEGEYTTEFHTENSYDVSYAKEGEYTTEDHIENSYDVSYAKEGEYTTEDHTENSYDDDGNNKDEPNGGYSHDVSYPQEGEYATKDIPKNSHDDETSPAENDTEYYSGGYDIFSSEVFNYLK